MMEENKEYYAFISYKREDEKWAKWLQHKLEHYKLPSNLNGSTDLPREIRPVFRDTSELNPGNLPQQIRDALAASKHLIVICSPRSAQSEWVNKEVETFIAMRKQDCIIPFIIDGRPYAENPVEECFPPTIRNLPKEQELLGANITEMGRDAAAVKTVAQMFGVRFDTLWKRYEREKSFRLTAIISFLIALAISIGIVAFSFSRKNAALDENNRIINQQKYSLECRNNSLTLQMARNYLLQGRPEMSLVLLKTIDTTELSSYDSVGSALYKRIMSDLDDSLSLCPIQFINQKEWICRNVMPVEEWSKGKLQMKYSDDGSGSYWGGTLVCGQDTLCEGCWYGDVIGYVVPNFDSSIVAVMGFWDKDKKVKKCIGEDSYGIVVFSIKNESYIGLVDCEGWFPSLQHPIALSKDGTKLIYREGTRENDGVFLVNFKNGNKDTLRDWDGPADVHNYEVIGGFSPDDKYYFLATESDVYIYYAESNKLLHKLEYENKNEDESDLLLNFEDVHWNQSNRLSVVYDGMEYIWYVGDTSMGIKVQTSSPVSAMALNDEGTMLAAVCYNGDINLWNNNGKEARCVKIKSFSPDDVVFSHNGKYLWIKGIHGSLARLDLRSPHHCIEVESPEYLSTGCEMIITPDDKYCILYGNGLLFYSTEPFSLIEDKDGKLKKKYAVEDIDEESDIITDVVSHNKKVRATLRNRNTIIIRRNSNMDWK